MIATYSAPRTPRSTCPKHSATLIGKAIQTPTVTGIIFTNSLDVKKAQKCIALSTKEAEFNMLSDATKHTICLRQLCHNLGLHVNKPLRIHVENHGAVIIAQSRPGEHHPRSKHYCVKIANVHNCLA